jgi:hydrogenase-4 component H
MRYPKLRELREAVKALIKGPYTIRYPYEPVKPYERFRGRPYFHEEECTGCGACGQVCPTGAIEVKDVPYSSGKCKRKMTVHWDVCIFCGQCQANCLTSEGIVLSTEFEFATTEKREDLKQEIEKEMVLCECCREPIAPFDQYKWTAKRLGPLSFANASLILFYLRMFNFASKAGSPPRKEEEISRSERIRVICPRCRRQAVIKS